MGETRYLGSKKTNKYISNYGKCHEEQEQALLREVQGSVL